MLILRQLSVVLFFVLAVVGTHVPALNLHALRLAVAIVLIGLVFFVWFDKARLANNGVMRSYFVLVVVWVIWGALGCMWTFNMADAFKEWLDVIFGLGIMSAVAALIGRDPKMTKVLILGWVAAYLVTGLVAVWELTSHEHLTEAYMEQSPDYVLEKNFVTSTFGNPNNYGAFLLMCFPFLIYFFISSKRRDVKLLAGMLLVSLVVFLILTGSRGGLIGLLVECVVFSIFKWGRRVVLLASGGLLGILTVIILMMPSLDESDVENSDIMIIAKLFYLKDELTEGASTSERLHTDVDGLYMLVDSLGVGVGPHEFGRVSQSSDMPYHIMVPNPHNFWIEVASQYGLIVIVMLVFWLYSVWRYFIKHIRLASITGFDVTILKMSVVGMAGYFFASMENSSYIAQPTNWLFLGTILALCNIKVEKHFNTQIF
jgi:teichuronic acid biosynthesis protein TuaE